MTRGYPIDFRAARGARMGGTVAVATARPYFALSVPNIAGALSRVPKVPAPPPALLIGLGLALLLGVVLGDGSTEADPPPKIGPHGLQAGKERVNSALTYLETRRSRDSRWNIAYDYESGLLADSQSVSYPGGEVFFVPKDYLYGQPDASPGLWQSSDLTVTSLPASWYYGVSTLVKRYDFMMYGRNRMHYFNEIDIYRNNTLEAVEPVEKGRPVVAPIPLYPADMPVSRPAHVEIPLTGASYPRAVPIPRRGIAFNVGAGQVMAAMAPASREVKAAATAATMKLISQTLGQLGETFDMARCFMYATGNTYIRKGRDGEVYEKAIPKWQWDSALLSLADTKGHRRQGTALGPRRQEYSHAVRGGLKTHSGQRLSYAQVGERFGRCMAFEILQDAAIAIASKKMNSVAAALGAQIGPLGVQSLYGLANGSIPYEGLFDLNLGN